MAPGPRWSPRSRRRRARRGPRPRHAAARRCGARWGLRPGGPRPAPPPGRGGPGCGRRRLLVGRVVAPGEAALFAVGGRLLAGEGEQRPHQAAVPGTHPEQGSAARRGGEPVEDRLDLVVGGVAGGDRRPAGLRQRRGGRVARLPGPGLQVAGARRAARALDPQRDPEPLAESRAVGLVRAGALAQTVVDVQGGDRPRPEQAAPRRRAGRRSRAPREHRDDRDAWREQSPSRTSSSMLRSPRRGWRRARWARESPSG